MDDIVPVTCASSGRRSYDDTSAPTPAELWGNCMMLGRARLVTAWVLVALAATPAVALAAEPVQRWRPDVASARAYAESRSGSVSFSVTADSDRSWEYRSSTGVPTASVLKVMFMVAYLRQPAVRDRALRDADRELLGPMIRRSANEPASRIADLLGPGPLNRLARRAGMQDFSYTRPWGNSRTSARDQARFMLHLRHYLPDRHAAYALRLLTQIVPAQQWGIGEVATPWWTRHFKGGWGSGSGAVAHQVVRLRHVDGTKLGIAVTTTGSPDHGYATTTVRGVFRRLLRYLPCGRDGTQACPRTGAG